MLNVLFSEIIVLIRNLFQFLMKISNYIVSTKHSYNIRSASNGLLFVPSYNSVRFGGKSIIHSATQDYNS